MNIYAIFTFMLRFWSLIICLSTLSLAHDVEAHSPSCKSNKKNCLLEKGSLKMSTTQKNILDQPLQPCGFDPMTGFIRNGYCETGPNDLGRHTVCAIVTEKFLKYTLEQGNDLSTPNPAYGFPGLKPGDSWCLCASRWLQAHHAGVAPFINAEATEISSLKIIEKSILLKYISKKND